MVRKCYILLLMIAVEGTSVRAEIKDIGTPFIRNFTKQDYKAGTQNWDIAQDQKGFMYFANNEGLLVFDGVQWTLYEMPNSSMVRSIYISDKGEIFIGAYNEMGKMVTGENGKLVYESLMDEIPEENRNFDDVWNIMPYDDRIIFQSYNALYVLNSDGSFTIMKAPSRFPNSFNINGRLFFNDVENGLFEYNGRNLVPLKGSNKLVGKDINSVMPYGDGDDILIGTLGKGLFIYDGDELTEWRVPANETLKKSQIFSATLIQDHYYAIGTIQNGVFVIDDNGKIIQHVNHKKGLQNNTVLAVFADMTGNLWLGLDNGVDYLTINSPVTFLKQPDGLGAGYATLIRNDRLYLGTNQGLFTSVWDDGLQGDDYTLIPGTEGQVWYLGEQNGKIICGHNNGTYIVEGGTATLISDIPGGWKYHVLNNNPYYMIGGTYSGLILFAWEDNTWKFKRRIKGFNESFRVFEEDDNGDIWMSHGFKGIYRVRLSNDLDSVVSSDFYSQNNGFPTSYNLNVFRLRNRIVFTSNIGGFYDYDRKTDSFVTSSYFTQLLDSLSNIAYLKEDAEGNIWYVSDGRIGVFREQEDLSFKLVSSPFTLLAGKFISGFESVYMYSGDHLFIGVEDGFAHYSPHAYYMSNNEFSTFITEAVAVNIDSTFYYGNPGKGKTSYTFPFAKNSFSFSYSAPVYDNAGNTEYSYRLTGYDEEWSPWSSSFSHEFSHLQEGKYIFEVRARNQLGLESKTDSLEFTILPPWYRSFTAYISYIIIFIILILVLAWNVNRRIEVSKRRERLKQIKAYREKEREYIRQALLSEKEIISMKNERLRVEMIQRDKELANQAMSMVRKNEFLGRVKEELQSLKKLVHEDQATERVASIISRINREVSHNKQREVFDRAFDEVHEDFMNKLKSRYPALTPTELRLCAFLKMNISTKEIAPLMNISVRGVEICRYRLRKKLGIDRSVNLTGLLLEL